jgi:acetolactate synthase small subunit
VPVFPALKRLAKFTALLARRIYAHASITFMPISHERTERVEITRIVSEFVLRRFEQEGCV